MCACACVCAYTRVCELICILYVHIMGVMVCVVCAGIINVRINIVHTYTCATYTQIILSILMEYMDIQGSLGN